MSFDIVQGVTAEHFCKTVKFKIWVLCLFFLICKMWIIIVSYYKVIVRIKKFI